MRDTADWALNIAEQCGASFADLRVVDDRSRVLMTKNGTIGSAAEGEALGIGIRVMVEGAWGFAATANMDRAAVESTAAEACAVARASATVKEQEVRLAPEKPVVAEWATPFEMDPFSTSIESNLDLLMRIDEELRSVKGVTLSETNLNFRREELWYASSEGARIHQTKMSTGVGYAAYSFANNEIQKRSYPNSFGGQWQN